MRALKTGVIVGLALLGLSAAPAQAFGPMMLLMLPMMIGGQHAMGTPGSGGDAEQHASHAPPPASGAPDKSGPAEAAPAPAAAGCEAHNQAAPAK